MFKIKYVHGNNINSLSYEPHNSLIAKVTELSTYMYMNLLNYVVVMLKFKPLNFKFAKVWHCQNLVLYNNPAILLFLLQTNMQIM